MSNVDVIILGLAIVALGVYAFVARSRRERMKESPVLGSVSDRWIAEHRTGQLRE